MKTYDETINAVFSKADAIFEERRKKAVKIKQTSYAVSGVCAAAIVGIGIWHMTNTPNLPDNHLSNSDIIEKETTNTTEATTNTLTAETTNQTTKHAETADIHTEKTKSVTTKDVTTIKTTISNNSTNAPSIQTSTGTTAISTITTTNPYDLNNITTIAPNGEEITTTTQPKDEITRKLPTIFKTIRLSGSDSIDSKMRNQELSYDNISFTEEEIGYLLKELKDIHLRGQYNYNGISADVESDAKIYAISGYSQDAMVVVKFESRDEFFLYYNKLYETETFGDFISAFNLNENDIEKECYYRKNKISDINNEEVWSMLTADRALPDVTQYCVDNNISTEDKIWINFSTASKRWLRRTIGVDPQGYIVIATNNVIPYKYFYIGKETAEEIINNLKN